jgi:AcrR family transcriptional regulator
MSNQPSTSEREEVWIMKGYEIFALLGESGLKVEKLSKEVGISKSSFYHYFADLDVFMEKLMLHHLKMSKVIADKESLAENINPGLINILLEHKTDLLFNRQLRIHANHTLYKETLLKSDQIIGKGFINLWMKDTKLQITPKQSENIFELALENFYLQINADNINREWLEIYFENLKRITQSFEQPLYGSG